MFYVIGGGGIFEKNQLIEKLREWGIVDPMPVVTAAEKGSVVIGRYRICSVG